jgi:hypothetical protein
MWTPSSGPTVSEVEKASPNWDTIAWIDGSTTTAPSAAGLPITKQAERTTMNDTIKAELSSPHLNLHPIHMFKGRIALSASLS